MLYPDRLINALYYSTSSIPAQTEHGECEAYSSISSSASGHSTFRHSVILHCRSTSNSKTIRSVTMCFRLQLCCPRCFPLSEKRVGRIRTRTSHLILSTRSLDGFQLSGKSSAGRMAFRCMCMQIDERPHRLPDQCLLNERKTKRHSKKDDTGVDPSRGRFLLQNFPFLFNEHSPGLSVLPFLNSTTTAWLLRFCEIFKRNFQRTGKCFFRVGPTCKSRVDGRLTRA